MQRIDRKWRPSLGLVIGGALAGVLLTPLIGIVYFRLWGNVLGWGEAALLVFGVAVAATLVLGFLLWRLVLRPVYALTTYARAVKAGRIDDARPAHFGTPEFRDLGQSVIDMGATLHNRATGLKAFSDHVTHELKSPLTSIQGAAELLQSQDLSPEDRRALCQTVAQASGRMDALLNDLRRHALAEQSKGTGQTELQAAVPPDVPLAVACKGPGLLPVPSEDLQAIIIQLAQNAAAHGADRLNLNWDGAQLWVQDNGSGIATGDVERVFDPYFTTRRDSGGTGMGLSIVRSLLSAHSALIEVVPSAKGAGFVISFA